MIEDQFLDQKQPKSAKDSEHPFNFCFCRMTTLLRFVTVVVLMVSFGYAAIDQFQVVPYPVSIQATNQDALTIDERTTMLCVVGSAERAATTAEKSDTLQNGCTRFLRRLRLRSGVETIHAHPLTDRTSSLARSATIRVQIDRAGARIRYDGRDIEYPDFGVDESYNLTVSSSGVEVFAATPFGALHAFETLLQLVVQGASTFVVPTCKVSDRPRLRWRGVMLDVVRHWMPVDVVIRTLNAMRICKLNVLHLHLTDDQGIRVDSRSFPQLTRITTINDEFFTPSDIRRIVLHAASLGIRVVPEFDLPAHSSSWLLAMPALAPEGGELKSRTLVYGDVLPNMLDPSHDATWSTLERFFDDMVELFPERFWHTGGDEPNMQHWQRSSSIAQFQQKIGARNLHELLAYINILHHPSVH